MEKRTLTINPERFDLGLSVLDFPEQNYPWDSYWKENSQLPPLYHGTTSYAEEKILSEGLQQGQHAVAPLVEKLRYIINQASLLLQEKTNVLYYCNLSVRDEKLLHFTLDPVQAGRYAWRAPESLLTLLDVFPYITEQFEKMVLHHRIGFTRNFSKLLNLQLRFMSISINIIQWLFPFVPIWIRLTICPIY